MSGTKWALLGLIGFALLVYGYKVHMDQQTPAAGINRGPIAVAAVRGASEGASNPLEAVSNPGVDYVNSLQADEVMARKAVKKYNAGIKYGSDETANSVKEMGQ